MKEEGSSVGVTEQLATFMVQTGFEDITGEAINLTKQFFLDWLGVSLAGYKEEPGKIVTEYTREIGGTPESRLVGSGVFTSAANAAFANGTMGHILDFDDTGFSHPTGCIMPVLLALGEKLKSSGKEILTAHVMGYECFGKLSYGARPYERTLRMRGYHPSATWGALAASATAAKLLKLDVPKTRMAMGLAGSQAAGLTENFGTMTKGSHSGNAARAGVLAALLVQKGYTASQEIIEGNHGLYHAIIGEGNYDLNRVTENLGKTWEIVTPGLAVKRYPSCGGNLRALDAILGLVHEHHISFAEVESLEVEMSAQRRDTLRFEKPTNGYQGKFSMEYNMAAAILDGKVDVDTFSEAKARSPEMREALGKVKVIVRDWGWEIGQKRMPVKVTMKDGRVYTNEVQKQRGHPENPITKEELLAKYRYCAQRTKLPTDKIERSIELAQNLETLNDISGLMESVTEQG
ncbi:MAG: MmgE/PrpD family protein [Chloroflexota bacterium]